MYITADDLYDRARKDTVEDWITDAVTGVDDTKLDKAIEWAQDEINQALADLYSDHLPFTTATLPKSVKNIGIDFAVYWLASRSNAMADTYLANYKDARARLLRLADGKEPLVTPDGVNLLASDSIAPDEAENYAYSTTESQTPIFTRDNVLLYNQMRY